jgi:rod shape-determining protein MreD
MSLFLHNILRFILLVLVQVFVLNNIRLLGFINPYIYVLFILLLPVKFSRGLSVIIAFILGLIIDAFSNTLGMHAFSAVLIAFLRNPVIKIFTSIEEGANPVPSFYTFGVAAFIKYITILVLIHHTTFFFLEIFTFVGLGQTLLRITLNTAITTVILLGITSFKKK